MKGRTNSGSGIWMTYHLKGMFLWATTSSVAYLLLRESGDYVHKQPNILHVFICTKTMMMVWVGLLFKVADLVVYGPPGGGNWSY